MNKWFIINILIILFAVWKITAGYHGIQMIIGMIALLLIIYNWTRQAVFSAIRSKHVSRKRKIALAQLSKKALPIHKWTGSTSLLIAIIHMSVILNRFGFYINQPKFLTGLFAISILALVVASGWLRWYRTTVNRRFIHWTLGFILVFSIILHLIF